MLLDVSLYKQPFIMALIYYSISIIYFSLRYIYNDWAKRHLCISAREQFKLESGKAPR